MANQFYTPLFSSNQAAQLQNNNLSQGVIIIDITGA